jgi:hypothetical protein
LQELTPAPMNPTHYDVFISRKSQDAHLAKELYDFLTSKGLKVFDSDHSLQEMGNADYSRAIDDALVNTEHLIVVGSSIENINSSWVEAEWRFFLNRKRSGKAKGNLLTIATNDVNLDKLPPSLWNYQFFVFGKSTFEKVLNYLKMDDNLPETNILTYDLLWYKALHLSGRTKESKQRETFVVGGDETGPKAEGGECIWQVENNPSLKIIKDLAITIYTKGKRYLGKGIHSKLQNGTVELFVNNQKITEIICDIFGEFDEYWPLKSPIGSNFYATGWLKVTPIKIDQSFEFKVKANEWTIIDIDYIQVEIST